MNVIRQPLSWYVDKLNRGEPFTSLLYGDGEFLVAAGKRTGKKMQNDELVTESLAQEMRDSLEGEHADVIRGTDPSIPDPDSYQGRDIAQVWGMHEAMVRVVPEHSIWHDGTVWEKATMAGELGPLLKVMRNRTLIVVSNRMIRLHFPIPFHLSVPIPDKEACSIRFVTHEQIRRGLLALGESAVVALCSGLSSIPLAMKLREEFPAATLLDLGSTFDLFAKIGTRGWQQELYRDEAARKELVAKNLEGSI